MTMRMLVADLADHGVVTSTVSVWRLVRSAGITLKKLCSPSSKSGPRLRAGDAQIRYHLPTRGSETSRCWGDEIH